MNLRKQSIFQQIAESNTDRRRLVSSLAVGSLYNFKDPDCASGDEVLSAKGRISLRSGRHERSIRSKGAGNGEANP